MRFFTAADLVTHLEGLRSLLRAAEQEPVMSRHGLAMPDPLKIQLARVLSLEQHPHALEAVRELCGSSLLMAPGEADLANPEIGALVERVEPNGPAMKAGLRRGVVQQQDGAALDAQQMVGA